MQPDALALPSLLLGADAVLKPGTPVKIEHKSAILGTTEWFHFRPPPGSSRPGKCGAEISDDPVHANARAGMRDDGRASCRR